MVKELDRPAVLNDKNQEQFVHGIFSTIAGHYDWLNTLLSVNMDAYWRRYTVAKTRIAGGGKALDLCCGTGKLTFELAKVVGDTGSVTGVDFCENMLEVARTNAARTKHAGQMEFVEANVLHLPFADDTFDCCTIGFGIRNIADIPGALREFRRVLKPGGRLVILELGKPKLPLFKTLYWFYFGKILPVLGQVFANVKGAYQWLPESLNRFPAEETVLAMMRDSGFEAVGCEPLTCGIVAVYFGEK